VSGLGAKTFEQCAGFLRIRSGDNPLDGSAVHPESYHIVSVMAADLDCTVQDLIKKSAIRKKIQLSRYVSDTVGMPTLKDILEELVGEIVDEYEETPPEAVQRIDDNTIELDARVYIDDLNEDFELNLPEDEDYDTVGGFVFAHLGYIPKAGKTFEYDKITFKVLSAEARRINRIRIIVPSTGQGPKE